MIGLVDIARAFDAFGQQTAATPASISPDALPPARANSQQVDPTPATDQVSISDEAQLRLRLDAQQAQEQEATRRAIANDEELAARLARDMAYRREVIVAPAAYGNLPSALYVSGASPASGVANIAQAQASLEQARLARIAVYEMEKARGTPPAEIYSRLLALNAARPANYGSIALAA